jgi:hypothetical protein
LIVQRNIGSMSLGEEDRKAALQPLSATGVI